MTSAQENDKEKNPNDRFARLRSVQTALRSDLTVSRQKYQGKPVYMVHDPVSFKNHRLSTYEYAVVRSLNRNQTLRAAFQTLVEQQVLENDDEEQFYEFIVRLHAINLVQLPVNNGAELYDRSIKIEQQDRKSKVLGFLFLKMPLTNPDRFLTQTQFVGRLIYTKAFLLLWLVAAFAAGAVLLARGDEFFAPLNGILSAQNLPFLWISLIVLKVIHELGHGYACKRFGGRVPEMGAMLLAGTPAAYVDASAAWAFPRKWQRLVVMFGGMFFESMVAIIAIFVWAFSANPSIASCAYQLFIMAGLVTIFFNANPLMRFDGYFILSETLGIQNLRPQADKQLNAFWKWLFLGIRPAADSKSFREKLWLAAYGIAAGLYKQFLIIAIAVILCYKIPLIGVLLATFHITTTIYTTSSKVLRYLLADAETKDRRGRARIVAASAFALLPACLFLIPVPGGIQTKGIVGFEKENFVRAQSPGFLTNVNYRVGEEVATGDLLLTSANPELEEDLLEKSVELNRSLMEYQALRSDQIKDAAKLEPILLQREKNVLQAKDEFARLRVLSPATGRLAKSLTTDRIGEFLKIGKELAVIVDGELILRTWLNEEQVRAADLKVGNQVEFRLPGQPLKSSLATIKLVEPAREEVFAQQSLTQLGGETIVIDPLTGKPAENIYEVQLSVQDPQIDNDGFEAEGFQMGAKVSLRFKRKRESIGNFILRHIDRFYKQVTING